MSIDTNQDFKYIVKKYAMLKKNCNERSPAYHNQDIEEVSHEKP